jgi:hypothetical protein
MRNQKKHKRTTMLFFGLLSCWIISCQPKESAPEIKEPLDAARVFVDATLKGDFKTSESYIIHDEKNEKAIAAFKAYYNQLPAPEKTETAVRSWKIEKLEEINETTSLITFSHEMFKQPITIGIHKKNNTWLIDFSQYH